MRVITRYNKISVETAKACMTDKSMLEAYAMSYSIKYLYSSSRIKGKNKDITGIMKLLSIGHARAIRVINDAIKFGFIRQEGKDYIANRLYSDGDLVVKLKVENKTITLNEAIKTIRKVVLVSKIKQLDYINDLKRGTASPESAKSYAKSKRKVRSKGYNLVKDGEVKAKNDMDSKEASISLYSLSKEINMTVPSLLVLIKELEAEGVIQRRANFEKIDLNMNYEEYKANKNKIEFGNKIRYIGGNYFIQLSNIYSIVSASVFITSLFI